MAHSHHHHDAIHVPAAAIRLLGLLLLVSLAAVAVVRWSGVEIREPDAPSVDVRRLHFRDMAGGAIEVRDADSGQRVDTIVGEAGFLRGALRVLSHDRARRQIG